MEGDLPTTTTKCHLCLGAIENNDTTTPRKKSIISGQQLLWNYLYHKNVRESVCSGMMGSERSNLPKFTFTFASAAADGGGGDGAGESLEDGKPVMFCANCYEELEKLEQLHKQLEAVTKGIGVQVGRISSKRRHVGDDNVSNAMFCNVSNLNVSMGASLIGCDNISMALRFLGDLCNEMSYSTAQARDYAAPSTSSREAVRVRNDARRSCMERKPVGHDLSPPSPSDRGDTCVKLERVTMGVDHVPEGIGRESGGFSNEGDEQQESPELDLASSSVKVERDGGGSEFVILEQSANPSDMFIDESNFSESESIPDDRDHLPFAESEAASSATNNLLIGHVAPPSVARRRKQQHRILNEDEKTKICNVCKKQVSRYFYDRHMRTHTGEKPFHCEFCNRGFSQQGVLNRHRKIHTGEKPFKCAHCPRAFARKQQCLGHMSRIHPNLPIT